ncbi:MAG: marine proteobacterial sortase target protein [Burkholderiales bacterium]|nr:marine proteobacterial sortase target protein [Burkholderiales bacterium]
MIQSSSSFSVKALRNIRDLLRFVSMAFLVGAISGIALIAIVMLFSSAAMAQTNNEVRRGELLFASEDGERIAATLVATNIDAQLNGLIARVKVVQTFKNPEASVREAVYAFPLPEKSAVDRMEIQIGERRIEGQIKERAQAKKIYETAKQEGRKAALVEQWRPNMFTTSVAPIGAFETVVVTIEYQQSLRYDQGVFSWRFPLAITPRYTPMPLSAEDSGAPIRAEHQEVTFASEVMSTPVSTQTPLSAQPLAEMPIAMDGSAHSIKTDSGVNIDITLAPGAPITEVISAYHDIDMAALDEDRYFITLADGEIPADRDFEISWTPLVGAAPVSALYSETFDGENYYYLMMLPKDNTDEQRHRIARELTFIIDTSGSMSGEPIRQAKQALSLAISRLASDDYFNVIEFNSTTRQLFKQPVPVNDSTLSKARHFVSRLQADGGTEMYPALQSALSALAASGLVGQVVFLTDGAVGNEEQLFSLIRDSLGERRLFTVGIGSAPNAHFMTRSAEFGRGTFTYIGDLNEVNQKMTELFYKLESPVLTNIDAQWSRETEMYPPIIGDLYAGEPLVAVAKTSSDGTLLLSGALDVGGWHTTMNLDAAIPSSGVATLWARRKIDALIDEGQRNGNEDAARDAVIALSLKHHLVSRFTSLVAVDVTPTFERGVNIEKDSIPNQLPHGTSLPMTGMVSTATPAAWNALLGFALLLISALLFRRQTKSPI